MMFEHLSKNKSSLLIISIIFLISGFIYLNVPIIFQEGSPCPQIKGIVELSISHKDMVELSANKYMTRSQDGSEAIKSFMKEKGYDFKEQMGSGYLFESLEGKSAVAVHKYYSRYYSIWNITIN